MGNLWKTVADALLELIYPSPRVCPLCGDAQPQGEVCQRCILWLRHCSHSPGCHVCGVLLEPGADYRHCPACLQHRRYFALARSAGPYEGHLKEAVSGLKYKGQQTLAKPLGALMAQVIYQELRFRNSQALVPVPLSRLRYKRRGFNQAALLAREVAAIWQIPVHEQAVVKVKETSPQTKLSRQDRLQNLQNAFKVTDKQYVQNKVITVVDDVLTTGTTASTIAQILLRAGAKQVLVLTLAATRYRGKK